MITDMGWWRADNEIDADDVVWMQNEMRKRLPKDFDKLEILVNNDDPTHGRFIVTARLTRRTLRACLNTVARAINAEACGNFTYGYDNIGRVETAISGQIVVVTREGTPQNPGALQNVYGPFENRDIAKQFAEEYLGLTHSNWFPTITPLLRYEVKTSTTWEQVR